MRQRILRLFIGIAAILAIPTLVVAQQEAVLARWPRDLEARPVAVAGPALTPRLQEALLASWHELAAEEGAQP